MPQITPNSSLLSVLSALVNADKSGRDQSAGRARASTQDDPRRQRIIEDFQARRSEAKRASDLSSGDELEAARARIRLAGERSPFNREAPRAGERRGDAQPGQIIDIRV